MLFGRIGLPEESPRTPSRWKQDKEHGRTAKAGGSGKIEPAVESYSKRGPDWIPMVSASFLVMGTIGRMKHHRSKLEMLNLSQNRLNSIQGLKMLGGLIALNLGTQA